MALITEHIILHTIQAMASQPRMAVTGEAGSQLMMRDPMTAVGATVAPVVMEAGANNTNTVYQMIVIKAYDPEWPRQFETIRASLLDLLVAKALRIDHIGSTSIAGLSAKDVIDVQVTVDTLDTTIIRKLVNAGYEHWGKITHDHVPPGEDNNPDLWEKLFFNQPPGERRANFHVRVNGKPNQRYPLLFRDYLRAHPNSAKSIDIIKREIVKRHAGDMETYYDIKDPVYDLIWDAALEWAECTDWKSEVST
jgi:GrpB-like predicted nucleotidyltransferase (UPF0157 family)